MTTSTGRSLLAIRRLSQQDARELVEFAQRIKGRMESGQPALESARPQRTVGLVFFESSTRTRVAFEQAASFLGHRTVHFGAAGSSISKGESLKDTILTLRFARLEAMVIRHEASGAAQMAEKHFGGPIVNAGDGSHEHPTQALGDALTILERKGRVEGLKIAIVGDVAHSRVARSNAWLLSKLGAEVRFVGPRTLIPSSTAKLPAEVFYELRPGLAGCDVVMCLRMQRERMNEGLMSSISEFSRLYQVNRASLKHAAPDAIVMHPGPMNRGIELDDMAADGPQSVILAQVANGIYAKTAALAWALGELE